MNSSTHTIDPDGEVIIILLNANSPFAQLDEVPVTIQDSGIVPSECDNAQSPEVTEVSNPSSDQSKLTAKQKKALKKNKKKSGMILTALECTSSKLAAEKIVAEAYPAEPYPAEAYPEEAPLDETYSAEEPYPEERPAVEATVPEAYPVKDPAPVEAEPEGHSAELPGETCFRIQVSAKHLMFASPVFKKILTGGWKESITFFQKGSVEITAETWDIEALVIVLRAIHGQHHLIPQKLTLEMLAKVAVIADYYECKNALYLLTDMWIKNMEETLSPAGSRDLILWLWIAWFFQLPTQFESSTSIAMSQSADCIDTLGLPIPDSVIGSMNECREEAINSLIVLLHETRDAFLNSTRGCNFECRSIMFGALTIQMQSSKLLLPKSETPFPGLTYNCLVQKISTFTSPKWSSFYRYNYQHNCSEHYCSDASFKSIFEELKGSLEGLKLERFTSS
ncbi:uncharacterized protein N7484_000547 [Penicillium longicatenatum]|uniref:uncharacterized protein n=1 Tax=Penicillium longicatenatum TaxID=1561947 RepID=UPI002547BBE2|nr:uncharacterized protein N7484_000547 [Penicillium longicatenatum]KAJ5661175.1 hypothetical protein N7484_000547 [Penicillium longicatenatum]